MNREIKFRAWDDISKKMYGYAFVGFNGECWANKNTPHNGEWINIGCGREDEVVNYDYELLQFTGLKDKNGKEIYEGDIVEHFEKAQFKGVVKYELQAGQYWIKWQEGSPSTRTINRYHPLAQVAQYGDENGIILSNVEVLGNIYENPELLKS